MEDKVSTALADFTDRFIQQWQQESGGFPYSTALCGVPSPCVIHTGDDGVYWQPQPLVEKESFDLISEAVSLTIRPDVASFFTSQYAGDMSADWDGLPLELVQVWSKEDKQRLFANQIGHLLTQRHLKLAPTLFLATTASELQLVSICNITGNVLLEQYGTTQREILAFSLVDFLLQLQPIILW